MVASPPRIGPIRTMPRKRLINLILLVAIIALGLLVWLTPETPEPATPEPLTDLNPSTIERIEISNPSITRLVLARKGKQWQMLEPYRVTANRARINILLDLLATPWAERFSVDSEQLGEFGLVPPKARLHFDQTEILFGGTHPYNYQRYLKIGNQVHLTKDLFPHHILAAAEAYVDHALIPGDAELVEIHAPSWRIFRSGAEWNASPPSSTSPEALSRWLERWRHLQVPRVVAAPQSPPKEQIRVTLQGTPEPLVFGVSYQNGKVFLVRSDLGIAYQLPDKALLTPPGLRD